MADDENNYKRLTDKEWRDSTQSRIVSLTDSEVTQNDRLDDTDGEIQELKEMLEGKPTDRDDNGIKGDLHDLSVRVNELRQLMAPDHLGQGGVIARLRTLERQAGIEETTIESRWKFVTAIAVAVVSAAALVLTNLDRIEPGVKRFLGMRVVEVMPQSKKIGARTNRKRRTRPAVMESPIEATDGTPDNDVPEGRSGNEGDAR